MFHPCGPSYPLEPVIKFEGLFHPCGPSYPLEPVIKFEGWVLISIGRAFILSSLQMKENINNCPLIDKYKLTKHFHQKNAKNKYCFSALVKAYMYVMEGPKSIESLQFIVFLSLNTPFKLNQNTKISLLMARFENFISVCN